MVKYFALSNGSVISSDDPGSSIRLHVKPSKEEISELTCALDIDEHTLFSSLDPDEVPRLEVEPDHFAIIWKRPQKYSAGETFKFLVSSIGVFLFNDRMEIIMSEDVPLFEGRHLQRFSSHLDVLLGLLSRTIYHFLGHLKAIDSISNEIKEKVNTAMENRYLLQMFGLSESLVYYLNAISSNGMVLEKIRNSASKIGFTPDNIELLEDVQIENNQCFKQAEIFSIVLTGLMDARGTVVNNNVNNLLKRLTIINTIFLPLNLIASIGGMSEYTMMTRGLTWKVSYLLFLAAMVSIGFLTYYIIDPSGIRRRKT